MKTQTHTTREGWTVLTQSDGVQKAVYLFRPGNDTAEADAAITTNRWTNMVRLKMASGESFDAAALIHCETKDQIIRRFIRQTIGKG